jgi:hypothetical protein
MYGDTRATYVKRPEIPNRTTIQGLSDFILGAFKPVFFATGRSKRVVNSILVPHVAVTLYVYAPRDRNRF